MVQSEVEIKIATVKDFDVLYTLGKATPEFKVGASGEFMEEDEFRSAIENPNGVFLLADVGGEIAGFVYAGYKDIERGPNSKWACLVYLVVRPENRGGGVAQKLYSECVKKLKERGITDIYAWANIESDGSIVKFLEKQGFDEGHKYMWMDKEI